MRAIFLDRDGVICENRPDHVKSWAEFRFLPGALHSLTQLARTGFATIVITNQAIINRGLVPASAVNDIHGRMLSDVRRVGGRIDRVMVCPHRADEVCDCRKPAPGLIRQAAAEMGIDLAHSYMIGDALTDVQAGQAAGCQTFMVMTGRGAGQLTLARSSGQNGFRVARDLQHAVDSILRLEAVRATRSIPTQPLRRSITGPLVRPALPGSAL